MTNVKSGRQKQHGGVREDRQDDYAHLLERLREEHLTGSNEENSNSAIGRMFLSCGDSQKHRKTYRSFKELRESGIRVKPSESNNLKNISFHCNFLGRLKMPRLLVDDSTAFKFMNLVALETCLDYENDFAITSYMCFLDSLIDTAEDVKELRVKGLIHNYLGSDQEVADLFNKMSRDLVPEQGIYNKVTESIHKYCNNPWKTTLAQLYYTHFSSPWTVFGFFGAIFYLILSIIPAYFSFRDGSRH
ncbi:Tetratricopeptide repeat (TPR)-like superfamily protein [Hibiscus syriacus]|uniref:Tetratricopeptide repeat (TPR)-like superfamily protein n=1 Tax=Hibiscus syriacus TaxID=106335 RepID=A0A6A3CT97_HIBSY|nr:Tetratricopeptide repeat (TPR)-like superfamily protein [Hibiscus syriacus]